MALPLCCPFCGKRPELFPKNPAVEGDAFGVVKCVNPRCPAQPEVQDGSIVADSRGTRAYQRLAIKRWNAYRVKSPKELTWSLNPPAHPGWWFYRRVGADAVMVLLIGQDEIDNWNTQAHRVAEWAGPIREPGA